jgi:hypothetical protein
MSATTADASVPRRPSALRLLLREPAAAVAARGCVTVRSPRAGAAVPPRDPFETTDGDHAAASASTVGTDGQGRDILRACVRPAVTLGMGCASLASGLLGALVGSRASTAARRRADA